MCVPWAFCRALALFGDAKQAMGEGKSGPVETGLTGPVATALQYNTVDIKKSKKKKTKKKTLPFYALSILVSRSHLLTRKNCRVNQVESPANVLKKMYQQI